MSIHQDRFVGMPILRVLAVLLCLAGMAACGGDAASPMAAADPAAPLLAIGAAPTDAALQQRLFKGVPVAGPSQSYLQYRAGNPTPGGRHSGIDYPGTHAVYAPVDGIVRAARVVCGVVVLEDARPLSTFPGARYAPRHIFLHLKDIRVANLVGQRIVAGTLIGTSSNAAGGGCVATGPHLHYEIRRNYTGTSGVGASSCSGIAGCTTATLTYDPYTFPFPTAPAPPVQRREIIVDEMSAGFTRSGTPSYWKQASIGWGGHVFYTMSDQRRLDNQGTWRPTLTTAVRGDYTVYVFVPRNYATTRSATYTIFHDGRTETRVVDQYAYSDAWVPLGRFYFRGDGSEYVRLGDRTGEPNTRRTMVAFDAVKFTP